MSVKFIEKYDSIFECMSAARELEAGTGIHFFAVNAGEKGIWLAVKW